MEAIDFENTYWIGGSPCAGKSSVAARLAQQNRMAAFHCDDSSDERTERMKHQGSQVVLQLSAPGKCARLAMPPAWQADMELDFYRDSMSYLLEELAELDEPKVIAEGADLLPELLERLEVPLDRAVWLVPTPDFQLKYYVARAWAREYVQECPNPAGAFHNWMQRDVLFAHYVAETAQAIGGKVICVNGERTIEQIADEVSHCFDLST